MRTRLALLTLNDPMLNEARVETDRRQVAAYSALFAEILANRERPVDPAADLARDLSAMLDGYCIQFLAAEDGAVADDVEARRQREDAWAERFGNAVRNLVGTAVRGSG